MDGAVARISQIEHLPDVTACRMFARVADEPLSGRVHELDVAGKRDRQQRLVHAIDRCGDLAMHPAQAAIHLGFMQCHLQGSLELTSLKRFGQVSVRNLADRAGNGSVIAVGGQKDRRDLVGVAEKPCGLNAVH